LGPYSSYTDNDWLNHGRSGKDKDKKPKKKPIDDPPPDRGDPEGGPNRSGDSFKKKIKDIISSIPMIINNDDVDDDE